MCSPTGSQSYRRHPQTLGLAGKVAPQAVAEHLPELGESTPARPMAEHQAAATPLDLTADPRTADQMSSPTAARRGTSPTPHPPAASRAAGARAVSQARATLRSPPRSYPL